MRTSRRHSRGPRRHDGPDHRVHPHQKCVLLRRVDKQPKTLRVPQARKGWAPRALASGVLRLPLEPTDKLPGLGAVSISYFAFLSSPDCKKHSKCIYIYMLFCTFELSRLQKAQ